MRIVIDEKLYNTETATPIAVRELNPNQENYLCETLYKTKAGRFFLYIKGYAGTRFRKPVNRNYLQVDESIVSLEKEEAILWCENRGMDASIFYEHFGIEDA